ncbi:transposase, partial [Streptomyces sp. NPDC101234]|uniref:transposase n=1 Tax=Streptomyces sp. NPDC101234 TaxID=3366138 RepID=UPI0037FF7351
MLLGLVACALLSGVRSVRGVVRWANGQGAGTLSALEVPDGAPDRLPVATTLTRALAPHPVLDAIEGPGLRLKRTRIIGLYTHPPDDATVVCADKLEPAIPRTFPPAPAWSPDGHRIKAELDYSRGPEKTCVYGALRVRDGRQITMAASSRNSVSCQQFLQRIEDANPTGELWSVTDNLSSHNSLSTRSWLEDHPRIHHAFIPVGACWLNLQEGRWRIFRKAVLVGRSFANRDDIAYATRLATAQLNSRARHGRFFWGMRLRLVCTLHGLPVAFSLTAAKADERETLLDLLAVEPDLLSARPGQIPIGDRTTSAAPSKTSLPNWTSGCCAGLQERAGTARRSAVQTIAGGHRVGQRDLQGPTQPRTAPGPHTRRRDRPRHAAHPRADRRDLAQRPHRTAPPTLTDSLRPLTWNRSSSRTPLGLSRGTVRGHAGGVDAHEVNRARAK